jgi:hypothetical protein
MESFARYFNGDECFRKHSKLQITGSVYCCSSRSYILAPAVKVKQVNQICKVAMLILHLLYRMFNLKVDCILIWVIYLLSLQHVILNN